jgi:hypothetical protein
VAMGHDSRALGLDVSWLEGDSAHALGDGSGLTSSMGAGCTSTVLWLQPIPSHRGHPLRSDRLVPPRRDSFCTLKRALGQFW